MTSNKKRLQAVARYMDESNPVITTAFQTRDLVSNALDEHKLHAFDQGFIRLCQQLSAWVSDGFRVYVSVTQDCAIAEQHIRDYLEPLLGQQIKHHALSAPWDQPCEPHRVIGWWTGEASAGEGYQFLTDTSDEPPMTDAEMLLNVDPSFARYWIPPLWLWRIPDFYGMREVSSPQAHSEADTKRELAFIHWQVWEAIEGAIKHAQSRATVTPVRLRRVKKPSKQSEEDSLRERAIREAISYGVVGRSFCDSLDDAGVKPLPEWKDWPGSWVAAYDGAFKKRIQDLKSRVAKKMPKVEKNAYRR